MDSHDGIIKSHTSSISVRLLYDHVTTFCWNNAVTRKLRKSSPLRFESLERFEALVVYDSATPSCTVNLAPGGFEDIFIIHRLIEIE